jgi:hypothetical protein
MVKLLYEKSSINGGCRLQCCNNCFELNQVPTMQGNTTNVDSHTSRLVAHVSSPIVQRCCIYISLSLLYRLSLCDPSHSSVHVF